MPEPMMFVTIGPAVSKPEDLARMLNQVEPFATVFGFTEDKVTLDPNQARALLNWVLNYHSRMGTKIDLKW